MPASAAADFALTPVQLVQYDAQTSGEKRPDLQPHAAPCAAPAAAGRATGGACTRRALKAA